MPTSDEDLQKKRDRVEKLREQVRSANAQRVTRETELANEVVAAQLDAEAAQLEAELVAAKDAAKVSNVKSGAEAPLAAAQTAMEQAVALQKAREQATSAPANKTENGGN